MAARTLCAKCGRVLIDADGKRWADAYFVSDLQEKMRSLLAGSPDREDPNVIWAWCGKCYYEETD